MQGIFRYMTAMQFYNYKKERGYNNMLHPSYHDLMSTVNSEVEKGETPIVNSRYSIVLATAKRARQLIDGVEPLAEAECPKALSIAIDELNESKIHILSEEEAAALEEKKAQVEIKSTEIPEETEETEVPEEAEEGAVSEEEA